MSTSYTMDGVLHAVMDTEQISDTFKKREFVLLARDGQYEQHVKFQLMQDGTRLIDGCKIGTPLRVHFNIAGKEYTSKKTGETGYFNNLNAWRIEATAQQGGGSESQADKGELFDDVPF